jgi:23S rRNA pseudouridine1911/1915/1917 synthase
VDAPIGRDPRNRLRMAVVDLATQSGKTARTDFELQATAATSCYVRCILHTGRTHQIRVHMASIGHPLVADSVYGGSAQFGLSRQALHATRLAFLHPVTGKDLVFDASVPADMQLALAQTGAALQSSKA